MSGKNFDDAIELTEGIIWVGFYDKQASLHCNPYLIVDEGEAVIIDPGSIPDFPVVMRKIIDVINPDQISTIIVSHQDPDVCGNMPVMEDVINRDDLKIVAHSTTHRLIEHYGINSTLYSVDEHDYRLLLKSGREIQFLYTPHLHSPGAMVTYDTQTGSLFSGDIFGALSKEGTLYTDERFPESMDSWHKAIMPGNALLKAAMERFEKLRIERIVPQHGAVIEGEQIQIAIDHLKGLQCGIDLMSED